MNKSKMKKIFEANDLGEALLSTSGDPGSINEASSKLALEAKRTQELITYLKKSSRSQDIQTWVIIFLTIVNLIVSVIAIWSEYY